MPRFGVDSGCSLVVGTSIDVDVGPLEDQGNRVQVLDDG